MPESKKYIKGPGLFRYGNTYQNTEVRDKLMLALYGISIRAVEESGRPRQSHKLEIVGSNPACATK